MCNCTAGLYSLLLWLLHLVTCTNQLFIKVNLAALLRLFPSPTMYLQYIQPHVTVQWVHHRCVLVVYNVQQIIKGVCAVV